MKKRLLSILLAALMLLTLLPTVAMATEKITSWAQLQEKINQATSGTTIKLTQSLTASTPTDTALEIGQGKNIILDLNGYTLDRGLSEEEATANGHAISVEGKLTVMDGVGGGKITGGYDSISGGGVYIKSGGIFTLEGGAISGNKSIKTGGGIYMLSSSTFVMTGGKITENVSVSDGGGGVFCRGSFTMSGGEIASNTALDGAGVYVYAVDDNEYDVKTHFTMTGGSIKNNIASGKGGGVYADNYDIDTLLLGGEISGNSAVNGGGGVCCNAPITVGGDIQIVKNTVKGVANNVFLQNVEKKEYKPVIQISKGIKFNNAKIGVTLESDKGTIVEKCSREDKNYFFEDNDNFDLVYQNGKLVIAEKISVTELLAVAVTTVIAVRSITGAVKLVVGVPVALVIAPQVLRTLGRLVFHRF